MKKFKVFLAVSLLSFVLIALAQRSFLVIGTGDANGVYYPVGGIISRIVNGIATNYSRLTVEVTAGSVENIEGLNVGGFDFAIVQSDVAYQAYHGEGDFTGRPIEVLRAVIALHPEPMHLICHQDAEIASFRDIKGKAINIGVEGSGIRRTVLDMLAAFGMSLSDLQAFSLGISEARVKLAEGGLDCFFYSVGVGSIAVKDTATLTPIKLIPLDDPELEALAAQYPYYVMATIPAGSYYRVDQDVRAFGVKALLASTTDLNSNTAYFVVKGLLENIDILQARHPSLSAITKESLLEGLSIPLHSGAIRAFKEASLVKP
ncbi:MAG: TAXI family TRAP transporter solute-binding subunit [Deinococcales bacterium]